MIYSIPEGGTMKQLFTLLAALTCLAPAFANDTEVVVAGDDETQEEVVINKGCGCEKGKDKKPPTK